MARRDSLTAGLAIAGLLAVLAAATMMAVARNGATTENRRTLIQTPGTWVAFSAEAIVTTPGQPTMVGKFYRSTDGSARVEQRTADSSVVLIAIANLQRRLAYQYISRAGEWTSRPLLIPTEGYSPPRGKTEEMRGLTRQSDRIEGFEVYRYDPQGGDVAFQAPALNFTALVTERAGGAKRVLSNIVMGEPDGALFDLPDGVTAKHLERGIPMGVIVNAPNR